VLGDRVPWVERPVVQPMLLRLGLEAVDVAAWDRQLRQLHERRCPGIGAVDRRGERIGMELHQEIEPQVARQQAAAQIVAQIIQP
jgi:hypothetical protein